MSENRSHNTKNLYVCDRCGGQIVTIDLDPGVTPMFLACRVKGSPDAPDNNCTGRMVSMMYPPEPWPERGRDGQVILTEPTWEWYKPDAVTLRRMRKKARQRGGGYVEAYDHVRRGGLLLRERTL